jgi:hypothetical protein
MKHTGCAGLSVPIYSWVCAHCQTINKPPQENYIIFLDTGVHSGTRLANQYRHLETHLSLS